MAKKTLDRDVMLAAMRKKMDERKQTRRDPDQFIPPKMKDKEVGEYYFRVLPELQEGETCKGGVCKKSSDLWYYENGNHFIDNQRHECPRTHDRDECPICQMGFDLMSDSDDKEYRKRVAKNFLPRTSYAINVYFLNIKKNLEAVRGKVMWYNAQKTVWEKMDQCINSDDSGDSDEPRACGLFYHPYEDGYTFKLTFRNKGDWNEYEQSCFVPTSKGPLIKLENGAADEEAIQKILDQRIYVQEKFKPRDAIALQSVLTKIMNKEQGRDDTEVVGGGIAKGGATKLSSQIRPSIPSAVVPKQIPKPEEDLSDDDGADEMPEGAVTEQITNELEEAPRPATQKTQQKPTQTAQSAQKPPLKKPQPQPQPQPKLETVPAAPAAEADDEDAELANLLSAIQKGK